MRKGVRRICAPLDQASRDRYKAAREGRYTPLPEPVEKVDFSDEVLNLLALQFKHMLDKERENAKCQ